MIYKIERLKYMFLGVSLVCAGLVAGGLLSVIRLSDIALVGFVAGIIAIRIMLSEGEKEE
ncbi:MAG: hypothetical protein Q8P40_04870 [Nitrospirota bacterium]|nr:hypothetical protein [Nitrospirota bacterium]